MARAIGISGIFRGKKGDGVFYRNGNAKSVADQQGWRQRVGTIANPKTLGQVSQRVKMAPAVNLYRALGQILDHSWQSKKYGGRSHSEFMKHSLLMKSGFPYLQKGDLRPVPGNFLISTGSLPNVKVTFDSEESCFVTALKYGNLDTTGTISAAALSEAIIANNAGLNAGDQLTFIACSCADITSDLSEASFRWVVQRFILGETVAADIAAYFNQVGLLIDFDDNHITFTDEDDALCAMAIVTSRPPVRSTAWQRSNTKLVVADDILSSFVAEEWKNSVIESYQRQESTSESPWYLNGGTTSSTSTSGGSTSGGGSTGGGGESGGGGSVPDNP